MCEVRVMMRNPSRRNRNIGTAKQGHGRSNRMVIPESWHDSRVFYEKLRSPVRLMRIIGGKELTFLVEETLFDHRHPCTIDDICHMLRYVPANDWAMLDIVVLRQPTRKQKILSNVWGRLSYYYETDTCTGVAIVLESQPCNSVLKWSKSLSPDDQKEINRLANDGHEVRFEKKHIAIQSTLANCRNTQLFRTIPHEIGHYHHYRKTNSPQRYSSLTMDEREAAAHRYADELTKRLHIDGSIPFDRLLDSRSLRKDNLAREWFE